MTLTKTTTRVSSPNEFFRLDKKSNKLGYFSMIPRAGKLDSSPDRLQHARDLEVQVEQWRSLYQKLQDELKTVRKTLQEANARVALKEQQIAALQQEHFHHVAMTAESVAEDDELIRHLLRDMTRDWKRWADDYASREFPAGSATDAMVREHICKGSRLDLQVGSTTWPKHGVRPRMVLLAQLASHIARDVIVRPFTSFHHNPNQHKIPISSQLDSAYISMIHGE